MENSNMLHRMIIFIIFITMLVACGAQNTVQQGNTAPGNASAAPKPVATAGVQTSPQAILTGTTKTSVPSGDAKHDGSDASSEQELDIAPISEDE